MSEIPRNMRLCVLLYHSVVPQVPGGLPVRERKYWISVLKFREHLSRIRAWGRPVLPLDRAWAWREAGADDAEAAAPKRTAGPVVLTFDDGRRSDGAFAWPLLGEEGWSATFFVNTATVGEAGYLSWREIRAMSAEGARFESHGHQHVDLTALDAGALDRQLRASKAQIEDHLGQAVSFLAVPYGRVNRRVTEAALAAGYCAICTSVAGLASPGARNIQRVAIHARTTSKELGGFLSGAGPAYWVRRTRSACLAVPKMLLLRPGSEQAMEGGKAQ